MSHIQTVNKLKAWGHLKFWKQTYEKLDVGMYTSNVFPDGNDVFKALELTAPKDVKIVILGQDPYPTKGHANGLAFSTYPHITPLPRSLQNIFKEYSSDLGYPSPSSGDLSHWAGRGILLLNTCLTVEEGKPGSHKGLGWEKLAYEVLRGLNEDTDRRKVFILWGKDAQSFAGIFGGPHLVISSVHPSPLSAGKGFFGSRPFSKAAEHIGVNKDIWKLP